MIEWIFVAVTCINQQCGFVVSHQPITEAKCLQLKKQFLSLPFKPEVTLAATQCMEIDTGEKM